MTLPSVRMAEAGLVLPEAARPVGDYVPALCHGDIVHVTGQLAFVDGRILVPGVLGRDVDVDSGAQAARTAALNSLSAAADAVGGIDHLTGVIEVVGYIACVEGFASLSAVLDGASSVFPMVFGEDGRHVRSNVGVSWLPLGSPVEIRVTFARGDVLN
jgi:enamine deaminase RidA (YjgF/YER057c/UK114 family)